MTILKKRLCRGIFTAIFFPLLACSQLSHEAPHMSDKTLNIVTGGYTDKGGEGIYGLTFAPANNQFGPVQLLAKTHHPSFGLQVDNRWYWVDEATDGQLLTYGKNADGSLSQLQKNAAGGASPCHLAVRADHKYLIASNYMGGNLAAWALDAQGLPVGLPQVLQHSGKGPTKRQEGPHAHWAGWAQLPSAAKTQGIYAVDLGIDTVFWYPQKSDGSFGESQVAWRAAPGDGPRHLVIHPRQPWVYIINELSNTLSFTQQQADGQLIEKQKLSTLPADFHGDNIAAHIALSRDGKFLYVSNRGHHSLSVFALAEDGHLNLIQTISSQGKWPRFFVLLDDAHKLIVANQDSDNLVVFNVLANGQLDYTGVQASVPRPTFVGVDKP